MIHPCLCCFVDSWHLPSKTAPVAAAWVHKLFFFWCFWQLELPPISGRPWCACSQGNQDGLQSNLWPGQRRCINVAKCKCKWKLSYIWIQPRYETPQMKCKRDRSSIFWTLNPPPKVVLWFYNNMILFPPENKKTKPGAQMMLKQSLKGIETITLSTLHLVWKRDTWLLYILNYRAKMCKVLSENREKQEKQERQSSHSINIYQNEEGNVKSPHYSGTANLHWNSQHVWTTVGHRVGFLLHLIFFHLPLGDSFLF